MRKKDRPQPPIQVMPNGDRYRLVVMRVLDTYDDRPEIDGFEVPAELLFIDDDDVVEIDDNDRFITAYVPESVFGKAPPPRAGL